MLLSCPLVLFSWYGHGLTLDTHLPRLCSLSSPRQDEQESRKEGQQEEDVSLIEIIGDLEKPRAENSYSYGRVDRYPQHGQSKVVLVLCKRFLPETLLGIGLLWFPVRSNSTTRGGFRDPLGIAFQTLRCIYLPDIVSQVRVPLVVCYCCV